jgi:hypothetical protein
MTHHQTEELICPEPIAFACTPLEFLVSFLYTCRRAEKSRENSVNCLLRECLDFEQKSVDNAHIYIKESVN